MRLKYTVQLLFLLSFFASDSYALTIDTAKNTGELDTLKIVYFGSSVPLGIGAKNNFGYTSYYTEILKQRAAEGKGKAWTTVNKSVGGDNTPKLLARWDKDLVPQKAKYVLIALSLGNEGIHEFGKVRFDQFKTNLPILIAKAREYGYTPVVTNCYAREDFMATDYDYIKQMNLWIQTLDVPTINLLGVTDDGTGCWVPAYRFNKDHPNDGGHKEMSYAIPPSLFDALASHKPLPQMVESTGLNWGSGKKNKLINFKPENTVHSFTTNLTIKAGAKGQVLIIADSIGKKGYITINGNGVLTYKSAFKNKIAGTIKITDGLWHNITLTHYYERSETDVYCDGILQGKVTERLVPRQLTLGKKGGKALSAKNWLFYRAGMNNMEVEAMGGKSTLLRSSLELYAPLDGQQAPLSNLAQSLNIVQWK